MTSGTACASRRLLVSSVSVVLIALVAGTLSGCGATPVAIGPSGIDGLTIPTPHPDPADFTARVDNPWFPLLPGSRWVYRRYATSGTATLVATVLPGTRRIDGVPTTAVRWQRRSRAGTTTLAVRWYAQDTAGNVWWFGQQVRGVLPVDPLAVRSWQAGRRGAEAGLVMAATPRDGDGYFNGFQRGVVERRSTVGTLDASVALPRGHYDHAVETEDHSSLEPLMVVQSYYARGVGLVAQQVIKVLNTNLSLVRFTRS
jgi:hypothetical protein